MHLGGQGPGSGVPARPLLLQSTGVRAAHRRMATHALCAFPRPAANSPSASSAACDDSRRCSEHSAITAAHGVVQLAGVQPLCWLVWRKVATLFVTFHPPGAEWTWQADMGASYAVGVIRGGRLLLAPLDQVMQLRPSLAHLDRSGGDKALNGSEATAADERASGAGPAIDAMDEDDVNGMEMEPVRVCPARKLDQARS